MVVHLCASGGVVSVVKCSPDDLQRLSRGVRLIIPMPDYSRIIVEADPELQPGVFCTVSDDPPGDWGWNRDGTDSWPSSTGGWLKR